MRVVLDTNIFISALAVPGSEGDKAIHRVIESVDDLIISREIIREVLEVLFSKFDRDEEELARVAVFLADLASSVVVPKKRIRVLKDDPDNRILECAVTGKADVIVTGDREMLKLKQYKNIRIISLREYLYSR